MLLSTSGNTSVQCTRLRNENVIQTPKSTANFPKKGECRKCGGTFSFEKCVKRNLGALPLEQDLRKRNILNLKL